MTPTSTSHSIFHALREIQFDTMRACLWWRHNRQCPLPINTHPTSYSPSSSTQRTRKTPAALAIHIVESFPKVLLLLPLLLLHLILRVWVTVGPLGGGGDDIDKLAAVAAVRHVESSTVARSILGTLKEFQVMTVHLDVVIVAKFTELVGINLREWKSIIVLSYLG